MRIHLAIDPGPTASAFLWWDSQAEKVVRVETIPPFTITGFTFKSLVRDVDQVSIEWIESFGMAVGQEVFRTVAGIGYFAAFMQQVDRPLRLVPRKTIKMHLCHSMRAKDANIRQALIDRFGPVGTKKQPGKLYGVSGHYWSALAVAIYSADTGDNPAEYWIEDAIRNKS